MTSLRTSKTGRQADDLIPNAEEQAVLRRMTGEWSGLTDCEVARRLNTAGIPAKKGGEWYAGSVRRIRDSARTAMHLSHSTYASSLVSELGEIHCV